LEDEGGMDGSKTTGVELEACNDPFAEGRRDQSCEKFEGAGGNRFEVVAKGSWSSRGG